MKKYSALLFGFFLATALSSQTSPKKFVLIEHFTNSNCSTCASKNPALFNLITQAQYADDVHHIAVHPKFPYPQCVFYQANTVENTDWTALYPVSGTPTIVMNGAIQNPSSPILTEAKLQTYLNQTSPLSLQVTESGPNNARVVQIKANAFGEIPAGNYKLFVAIAEKTVNQLTPNGEAVHHNVFRKMLSAVSGDAFTIPAAGASTEYSYNYTIPNSWVADEVYVLAFVKEVDTKQVLNSGTRFDPIVSGTNEAAPVPINISPNPSAEIAQVVLEDDLAQGLEVFAANGERVLLEAKLGESTLIIPTANLSPGLYFVKVQGQQKTYVGKFVKI